MSTTPEKLSDTNSPADPDQSVPFPAWLVQGWAGERSRIRPADADELTLAWELIDDARTRGITVSLTDLGVRVDSGLAPGGDTGETSLPVFGTIEDKVVQGNPTAVGSTALSPDGQERAAQQLQLPPATGATS